MGDSKMHADRLREMAEWDQPGWKTSLLAGAEALEVLEQIIHDLPAKRDWLDPVLEARAKEVTDD